MTYPSWAVLDVPHDSTAVPADVRAQFFLDEAELERVALIQAYYRPHHARLEAAVTAALERHGRCLMIDCHSFPGHCE